MLTYFDDEVKKYHPVVEKCLNDALKNTGLDHKYEIKHHLADSMGKIPDFVLRRKDTRDWVSVIEVKKTPSQVISKIFGLQAMGYVANTIDKDWSSEHPYHFCVTNIERTRFFCYRDKKTSPLGCVLKKGVHEAGGFSNYTKTLSNFTQRFQEYFEEIDRRIEPEIGGHFLEIESELKVAFDSLTKTLNWGTKKLEFATSIERENIIYELLRISFYYYIQGKYMANKSKKQNKFTDLTGASNGSQLVAEMNVAFNIAMEIDFADILSDNEDDKRMFPEQVLKEATIADIFTRFLKVMNGNTKQGMSYKSELSDFVQLITDTLYDSEEMRIHGKVMSDEMLANILAGFAINSADALVLDPSCGDGNLLIASYNRIQELKKKAACSLIPKLVSGSNHNQVLSQIHGIELDRNLVQLSRFKLICTDLSAVNKKTQTNISIGDSILGGFGDKYDALVMNPPFIRNDTLTKHQKGLAKQYKSHLAETNGEQSLWSKTAKYNTSQPNYYHYHIEKCLSYLKEDGVAATIVMEKMLHNESGEGLKNLLLNYLEAIISYPPKFFEDSKVTTCILIFKKKPTNDNIGFLNIKNTSLLANIDLLKDVLKNDQEIETQDITLRFRSRLELDPKDNWKHLFLPSSKWGQGKEILDNFLEKFNCIPITEVFKVTRGNADNNGGKKHLLLHEDNPIHQGIEPMFRGPAVWNSHSIFNRHLSLRKQDIEVQEAVHFPSKYDDNVADGFPNGVTGYPGFRKYWDEGIKEAEKDNADKNPPKTGIEESRKTWRKRVNSAFGGKYDDIDILIPRTDRTKHAIYLNTLTDIVVYSTNIALLMDFKLSTTVHLKEKQKKFHTAFLLSTFGQLQIELVAGDQEGARKLELGHIKKLFVPNSSDIDIGILDSINLEFDKLAAAPSNFIGVEGVDGVRKDLDLAVGTYLFSQDTLGFSNVEEFVEDAVKILERLPRLQKQLKER